LELSCHEFIFDVMKNPRDRIKTFTYGATEIIKKKAAKKAKQQGMTLSEKIFKYLKWYVKDNRKKETKKK
jgi:hypothetical protein